MQNLNLGSIVKDCWDRLTWTSNKWPILVLVYKFIKHFGLEIFGMIRQMMYFKPLLCTRSGGSLKPISLQIHTHPSFWPFSGLHGPDSFYISGYVIMDFCFFRIMRLESSCLL